MFCGTPGTVVAVIELEPVPLVRLLAPSGHWIPREAIEQELRKRDFRKVKDWRFLPGQSFQLFVASGQQGDRVFK